MILKPNLVFDSYACLVWLGLYHFITSLSMSRLFHKKLTKTFVVKSNKNFIMDALINENLLITSVLSRPSPKVNQVQTRVMGTCTVPQIRSKFEHPFWSYRANQLFDHITLNCQNHPMQWELSSRQNTSTIWADIDNSVLNGQKACCGCQAPLYWNQWKIEINLVKTNLT